MLIDAAADGATSQEPNDEPELLRSAAEEGEDDDEGIVPTGCICRSCHAELEVTGRLKGTETLELLALARSILALLPTMMQWVKKVADRSADLSLLLYLPKHGSAERSTTRQAWIGGAIHDEISV